MKPGIVNTLLFVLLAVPAFSQYRLVKEGSMEVKGTSTLHDWEMKSSTLTGQADFVVEGTELKGINSLSFSMPAESLKSGKDAMDKNAYKSLKTSSSKNITFQVTKVTSISKSGAGYEVTCEGKLQIAGTTQTTTVKAMCTVSGNTVKCTGEKKFKMSEYKVEPPSFMFGSVKTGDEITILFNVTFTN